MGESKEYMTQPEENGSINISEEVIAAIAVGAAREVEGVTGMMTNLGGTVADLMSSKKSAQKGVRGVRIDMTGTALVLGLGAAWLMIRTGGSLWLLPAAAGLLGTAVQELVRR